MIQKILLNKIINLLAKNFKLFKLMKYVEEPNELDHKVIELENKILKLEQDQHPPMFTKEERDTINTRLSSHSDRLIAIEKKQKQSK